MACPKCGANATGQFCGDCGTAIREASPPDVTEAFNQSVAQTSVLMSSDAPDADGDQVHPSGRFFHRSPHAPPVSLHDPKSIIRKLRDLKLGAVVGLVVTAVVIAVIAAGYTFGGSGTGNTAAASGTTAVQAAAVVAPTTEAPLPHDTCVLQLLAVAHHMQSNGDAVIAEDAINGVSDPFVDAGGSLRVLMLDYQYQSNASAGQVDGSEDAARICTTVLNDQIRPNYPTDGTYPYDGTSSSSGSSGADIPSCPLGQVLGSDGQGNMVCSVGNS